MPKPTKEAEGGMQFLDVERIYQIEQHLGTGRFGTICRARHRHCGATVALKLFPRNTKLVRQADFMREYNTSLKLAGHPNIADTYEGAYYTPEVYYFVQELSACGSLRDIVEQNPSGIQEEYAKRLLKQLLDGLEFMHCSSLVHRNLQAKNVLVFEMHFTRIKLTDFGLAQKKGTTVKIHPPELCEVMQNESYTVAKTDDIWAVGVLMFFAICGSYPWEQAKLTFHSYWEWTEYLSSKNRKVPNQFGKLSERMLKFFRRNLNPKPDQRYKVREMHKYLKAPWLKSSAKESAHLPSASSEPQLLIDPLAAPIKMVQFQTPQPARKKITFPHLSRRKSESTSKREGPLVVFQRPKLPEGAQPPETPTGAGLAKKRSHFMSSMKRKGMAGVRRAKAGAVPSEEVVLKEYHQLGDDAGHADASQQVIQVVDPVDPTQPDG